MDNHNYRKRCSCFPMNSAQKLVRCHTNRQKLRSYLFRLWCKNVNLNAEIPLFQAMHRKNENFISIDG